jgi:adenylate cyclase
MKIITHWALAFITAALLIFAHYDDSSVVQTVRLKQFDLLQQTDTPVPSQDIAILEIDEATIEKYGQWPWERTVLADMIMQLRKVGAGIIVLPMVFSEEDRLGGDHRFVDIIIGNGVVVAQVGSTQVNRGAIPRGVAKIGDPLPYLFEWPGMLGPIPLIGENADGVGVVNTAPEVDGVVRRVPLIMRVGEETYPSLAVEVIRVATAAPSYQIKAGAGGVEKIRIPGYPVVNTDPNAQIWLRWNKQFDTISAASDDWSAVEGKTVIIGITADGIGGLIASPTGAQYNYIPAAVTLQTMIDGDQIQRPFWANLAEIGTTAILTILLVLLARFAPYYIVGGAIVVFVGGLGYGALYAWQNYLYLMDAAMPVIAVVLVGLHAVFARFVREFRLKQQIKAQFGTYVNPTVVERLQKDPSLIKLGGEEKVLSCVMTDMRNFTGLGESYGTDVEGFTKTINAYMTCITAPVLKNDGTIIKYIGDASMHIHGAPLDDEHHARTAVQTALDMIQACEEFNDRREQAALNTTDPGPLPPRVGLGAGVNTGKILVGNIGSEKKLGYDCLGDPVSVAARLESQTKSYGVLLIVGPDTVAQTKNDFDWFELDNIAVKGKEKPLRIYAVHKSGKQHKTFLKNYYEGNWDRAIKLADNCSAVHPKMSAYYMKMKERMRQGKPADWDGIYRATSK